MTVKYPGYGAVRFLMNGATAGLVPEAPNDGQPYLRKSDAWSVADAAAVGAIALSALDTDPTFAADSDALVPSQKAVATAIAAAIVGLWDPKGGLDCSANPNYPAALKGDTYVVTVAGKVGGSSGMSVGVGDVIVCFADNAGGTQAAVGSSWDTVLHSASLTGALLAVNNLSDVASAVAAKDNISKQSANIASAATTDLSTATGDLVDVTGSTAITSFGTCAAGVERTVRFTGTPTITYDATSLILPTSANIVAAAGDVATFRSLGSGNWLCVDYQRASGQALASPGGGGGALTLISTQTLTATGVPAAFTSIPGTYADLVLVIRGRASNAVAEQIVTIQFNGDTAANYDYGASFEVNTYGQTTGIGATSMTLGGIVGDTAPANYPSHLEAVVSNYAGTTFYKNVMAESREEKAASSTGLVEWIAAGTWKSTAAINQLAVLTSLKAGSIVSLYGRS